MPEANLGNDGAIFNTEKLKASTPQVMSRFPLNAEQMKNLAAYCAAKKLTLIDFLLNNVGFELKIPYTPALRAHDDASGRRSFRKKSDKIGCYEKNIVFDIVTD